MVTLATIRQCNARFASEQHRGWVGVLSGATGGIGAGTLTRMVQNLHDSTFYVLGRSETKFASQKAELMKLNPSNKIIFLNAQVSLLKDIDAACEHIKKVESKVDFVYMSPGVDMGTALLMGPQYTEESLEQSFSISYYARFRLASCLLPLLRQSPHPRVLSVLNGGREESINTDDVGLAKSMSIFRLGAHTTTMTTLAMEHLAAAQSNRNITFLHAFPGMVKTDIINRLTPPADQSTGLGWRVGLATFRGIGSVVMGLFGMEVQDCGDRQAYLLTSDAAIPQAGAWRIDASSEVIKTEGVLKGYREEALGQRVWAHTEGVFERCYGGASVLEGGGGQAN